MSGMVLELFGGPGGMSEGARMVGVRNLAGIELDKWACATRAAAGHRTVRADVAAFDARRLAGRVQAVCGSPPCIVFSMAGKRAGVAVTDVLDALIRDLFDGGDPRGAYRREMARLLTKAWWPDPKMTREKRSAAIWKAARSASLVAEPARFIAACDPEWVALEQVPAVLPLWEVYADELRKRGYSAWCGLLNSADYGVPQTRIRAILIASRVRQVRPGLYPTHYDPRKGAQLFGTPWRSMADALGWGATGRPAPTATAGGTATGGAEPFGHRDRQALEAERDAGRWVLGGPYRTSPGDRTRPRGMDEPATTVAFGHSSMVLRRDRGAGRSEQYGERDDRTLDEPAPTISAGTHGSGPRMTWVLQMDTQSKATLPRPVSEPAPTIQFAHRANLAAWVHERPDTSVMGDPRIGRPGHKGRESGGESHFAVDSVRITPEEAAALQSFPPGYPFQGSKTAVFGQIGNAVPPLLAAHVLSAATGLPLPSEIAGAA